MRTAALPTVLSLVACLVFACTPPAGENVAQAPASPPASATGGAPCPTGGEIEQIVATSKATGPRTKGDWRYTNVKCAGGWATLLSESVKTQVDAMMIVLRFDGGAWTIVANGSAVNDQVPESLRGALSQ